ncbi:hypothetical protein OHA77_24860 [Streptosporangium sp. NBC_01639]|uniref:hypothetical protein n=1 Tax=Streptosporangium sp. NBC_01639 TaxID=2975948 RepID=UPI0038671EB1|nr:hypothetical protein OHA77_24860 [Streptosporangium sp. NBC_01639]
MRATLAWLERSEQAPPPMTAPKKVSPPYSPAQLGRLRGWAERLPGQVRGDALALMALAVGCGLTSGEMAAVRTGHLRRLDSGATVVTVPGTERLIVCRAAWEDILTKPQTGPAAPSSSGPGAPPGNEPPTLRPNPASGPTPDHKTGELPKICHRHTIHPAPRRPRPPRQVPPGPALPQPFVAGDVLRCQGEHPCRLGAYGERSAGVVPQPEVDQRGITATRSLSDSAETAHSLPSWSVSRTTAAGMSITPYGRLEPRSNRIITASVQSDIRIKIP